MRLEDLMARAAQYDETLARDIKDYIHGRKYGLVYEASKPEFVRMWNKPVVRGDIVNILPPRGEMEDTKSENDPSEIVYKVLSIDRDTAKLQNEETREETEVAVDDVVPLARFDKPIYAGLREMGRVERGGDKPYHVVINGENFHALQALVYAYQGMVDCIYIDPPYNTGAKDWKYNNNYVGSEDVYRHSKWLTFIEDRLKLAKKLLNPKESSLILTIDEKEYLRVGLLLEQMFPEAQIQMICTMIKPEGTQRRNEFSRTNEYIYFVMFGEKSVQPFPHDMVGNNLVIRDDAVKLAYKNFRRTDSSSTRAARPNQFYPIFVDEQTGKIVKVGDVIPYGVDRHSIVVPDGQVAIFPLRKSGEEMLWRRTPNAFKKTVERGFAFAERTDDSFVIKYLSSKIIEEIDNGEIEITGSNPNGELIGHYINEKYTMPKTMWMMKSHNARDYGSLIIKKLFGGEIRFPFPKSLYAVEDALKLMVSDKKNALIVDFFAGSGTTAHAVMRLNRQDGGQRYSISVTNNEVSADDVEMLTKKGLRQGDEEWEKHGICRYATIPRLTAAITGRTPSGDEIEGSYGVTSEYFVEVEGEVLNPETQKAERGKYYKLTKQQDTLVSDPFPMAEGFKENAIFFDLEYLEPTIVNADLAYDNIAAILWLCGGCKGEILSRHKGYVIGETYAVLFDPRFTKRFVDTIVDKSDVGTVFIVTDAAERYRSLCAELPDRRVIQLYDSYLRSFEINAVG